MSYDILIIGAGHNGLTCACYLAKAGLKVAVVERRPIAGGAVCTEDNIIPGYKIDVGSSAHIMIHLTPVLRDLELHRFGLEYLEMDPWASYPIPQSNDIILFWRDLNKTCESIAKISPQDAETYRHFVLQWQKLNEAIFDTFLQPPTFRNLAWTFLRHNFRDGHQRKLWSNLDIVRQLMAPYRQLIEEKFTNEHVRTALEWLAAQAGPAPTELAAGDLLGWNAMIHKSGAKRAKGGSGALTQAMVKRFLKDGGELFLDAEINEVKQAHDQWQVTTLAGQTYHAKKVVCAMHVVPFFTKLLQECPASLKKRIAKVRVGNGFGMIVRHAVSELPRYTQTEKDALAHRGLQLLCPNRHHLLSSYLDYQAGLPPKKPSVVAMTFTALDPSLAPEGKHLLFTWGQWHPYALANGENWDAIAEREADKLYDLICHYAPNMRDKLIDRFIQTPLEIERRLGLVNANVMHLEMSLDQMFFFRPLPELSNYQVPSLPNLYLTGASTHPGGGVFAASGYNTAHIILKMR